MTKELARNILTEHIRLMGDEPSLNEDKEALSMAIQALSQEPTEKPMCDRNICLSNEYNGIGCDECIVNNAEQEPCQLLIIKSDILLHQDERRKWMESIKREKENGVIILPPYFEPLLVPNDIEISIEEEPTDAT